MQGALLTSASLLLAACAGNAPAEPGATDPGSPSRPVSSASATPSDPSPSAPSSPAVARSERLLGRADLRRFRATFGPTAAVAVQNLAGDAPDVVDAPGKPYAWSTIKVVLVAQTLVDAGGPGGLTPDQRSLIQRALSNSDNEAAAELHRGIMARHGGLDGAAATMTGLLRTAGDEETTISTVGRDTFSTYGQTLWPVAQQSQFLASVARGCVLDGPSTRFLIDQMGSVAPDQRWGLGMIDAPAFKGGWGPDPDGTYLVRQFGVAEAGGQYVASISVRGSYESAKADLSRMALWLADHVRQAPRTVPCL